MVQSLREVNFHSARGAESAARPGNVDVQGCDKKFSVLRLHEFPLEGCWLNHRAGRSDAEERREGAKPDFSDSPNSTQAPIPTPLLRAMFAPGIVAETSRNSLSAGSAR
jgi:hypothetical protein